MKKRIKIIKNIEKNIIKENKIKLRNIQDLKGAYGIKVFKDQDAYDAAEGKTTETTGLLTKESFKKPGGTGAAKCTVEISKGKMPFSGTRNIDGSSVISVEGWSVNLKDHESKIINTVYPGYGPHLAIPTRPDTTQVKDAGMAIVPHVMKTRINPYDGDFAFIKAYVASGMTHCLIGAGEADSISTETLSIADDEISPASIKAHIENGRVFEPENFFSELLGITNRVPTYNNVGLTITIGDEYDGTKADFRGGISQGIEDYFDMSSAFKLKIEADFDGTRAGKQVQITSELENGKVGEISSEHQQVIVGSLFPTGGRRTYTLNKQYIPATSSERPAISYGYSNSYSPKHNLAFGSIQTITKTSQYGNSVFEVYFKLTNEKSFRHESLRDGAIAIEPENMFEKSEDLEYAARFIGEALRDWVYLQVNKSSEDVKYYIVRNGIKLGDNNSSLYNDIVGAGGSDLVNRFVKLLNNPGSKWSSRTDSYLRKDRRKQLENIRKNPKYLKQLFLKNEKLYTNDKYCQGRPGFKKGSAVGSGNRLLYQRAVHCITMVYRNEREDRKSYQECIQCKDKLVVKIMRWLNFNTKETIEGRVFSFERDANIRQGDARLVMVRGGKSLLGLSYYGGGWEPSLINPNYPSFDTFKNQIEEATGLTFDKVLGNAGEGNYQFPEPAGRQNPKDFDPRNRQSDAIRDDGTFILAK